MRQQLHNFDFKYYASSASRKAGSSVNNYSASIPFEMVCQFWGGERIKINIILPTKIQKYKSLHFCIPEWEEGFRV